MRAAVAIALLATGCQSRVREFKYPPRPDVAWQDEGQAFECFTKNLPSLIREFHQYEAPDHVPSPWDAYYVDPANQRYYVRDEGERVRFLVVTRQPPHTPINGIFSICMDGCGAFLVSYPKDAKDCEAHPVETGGRSRRLW